MIKTNDCFMIKKNFWNIAQYFTILIYRVLYTNPWKQKQSTILMTCVDNNTFKYKIEHCCGSWNCLTYF